MRGDMRVFTSGRQTGKTQQLLKWASEQPDGIARVIVTHSLDSSMQLLRRARDEGYNVESWQFVSVVEMKDRGPGFMSGVRLNRRRFEWAIDNADIVLEDLIGAPLTIITVTGQEGMPCPVRSSITDQPCQLPAGHPEWKPTRFHKYGPTTGTSM